MAWNRSSAFSPLLPRVSPQRLKSLNAQYLRKVVVVPDDFLIEEYVPGDGGFGFPGEGGSRYDFENLFQLFNHLAKQNNTVADVK